MESTKDLDWMLKRLYSIDDSKDKIALKQELLDCWNKCREEKKPLAQVSGYDALQMLYDIYGHSQFMRIVILTMRVGFDKNFIEEWESKRLESITGKSGAEQSLPLPNLSGLKALVKNWDDQEHKALNADQGSLFLEFLGSKNDLCKPEYIIGAVIEQVRRIRRGSKSNNNYLEITNGLLKLAQLKWEEYDYNKVKVRVPPVPDYNVMPNKYLNLLIRYQELLNIGKRGYPIERISGNGTPRTDLKRQLEEYLDDLGEADDDDFDTKDIFEWWAYRSLVRNSIRWMSPKEETKRLIKSREEVIEGGVKKKYTKRLQEKGTSLKEYEKQADILVKYHKAQAKFLNDPHKYVKQVSKRRKRRPDFRPELDLYRAISGDREGLRKSTRLFVKLSKMNVIRAKYSTGTKDSSCLLDYLENSIRNVQMASNIVVAENHYLSVAMQVLLATDLMVRVRWFAGPKKSAEYKGQHDKITKGSLDKEANLKEAKNLQEKIVGALRGIQKNLELVVPEANKNLQEGPVKLIEYWAEEIEKLKLEKKNTDNIDGVKVELSALGCLCHTCGGFVNWGWRRETDVEYGSKGREKPKEKEHLKLLYKSGNKEKILRISPEKEGFEEIYPYVIPLTSGSSS